MLQKRNEKRKSNSKFKMKIQKYKIQHYETHFLNFTQHIHKQSYETQNLSSEDYFIAFHNKFMFPNSYPNVSNP